MAVATKQKPRSTTHHRKRHGHHQRRSNHFMKAYWPYLPVALIVGVGMLISNLWMKPNVLSYATNMTASGLLAGTNSERAKANLSSLSLNPKLSQAAQAKALDMVDRDYWSHTTPDGQQPWVFINNTGYQYVAAGENLAYGFNTSQQTVTGWMNSPGHKANVLSSSYSEVGFGIANSEDFQGDGEQTIVVAMYAKPVSAPAPAASSEPKAPDPGPAPEEKPEPKPEEPATDEQPIAVGTTDTEEKPNEITVSATVPGDTKVSRIQIATSGAAPWSLLAASVLAVGLLAIFIARHSLAWHRALIKGEAFFLKHKMLDIVVVAGIVVAALLSQTAGFIQ